MALLSQTPTDRLFPESAEVVETVEIKLEEMIETIATLQFIGVDGKKVLTVNLKTGNVEIQKGATLNEASKLFWRLIQEQFPVPCAEEKTQ